MSSDTQSPWGKEIDDLRAKGLYRCMPPVGGIPGRTAVVNGTEVLNFSSNNYLGLAGNPEVIQALVHSAIRYGAGATASRLIAGNTEAHRDLEQFIAQWKNTEAALVFGSGYQANVGVISSVVAGADLIISDQLNHASIIDGCRLSRAKVSVYRHLDLNHVEELLQAQGFRRKLAITESVFSMDGDKAPLGELMDLCRRHGALLMVDEAHATGIFGPKGQGLAQEARVVPDIQMGTLGKAVGVCGAYVAGAHSLVDLLINRARSLIYTTALSPALIGAAMAALEIISSDEGSRRRELLARNVQGFFNALPENFRPVTGPSHIVPVLIGDSKKTMDISARCMLAGIFAHGIRYPTVPEGTARLRFTLTSEHTPDDVGTAVRALVACSADAK